MPPIREEDQDYPNSRAFFSEEHWFKPSRPKASWVDEALDRCLHNNGRPRVEQPVCPECDSLREEVARLRQELNRLAATKPARQSPVFSGVELMELVTT